MTRQPPRTAAACSSRESHLTRLHAPAVYIADTMMGRGRGIFAGRDFRAGGVVEIAPDIIPESTDTLRCGLTLLRTCDFNWQVLAKTDSPSSAISAGYGGMYNRAGPASLRYRADPVAMTLIFSAVRNIDRHQELAINYSARGGRVWHDSNWFMQEDIRLIRG